MRTRELTKRLAAYDGMLYAVEHKIGRIDIYRRSSLGCNPPHYLFSLTDTWKADGRPIEYGSEVVMERVKAQDLWRDDTFVDRWIKEHEKFTESKDRERKNSIESFLYDFHSQFKKATDSVHVSNMDHKF